MTTQEVKNQFDTWLETQTDEVKTLMADRFSPLENTIKALRGEKDILNKELKELAKKIDKDSEAGTKLSELTERLAQAEKKSTFLESAAKQGVLRPSAAYAIANADGLFADTGEPDWDRIRESVPELFKVTNTNTNAGSGTNKKPVSTDVNPIRTYLQEKHKK